MEEEIRQWYCAAHDQVPNVKKYWNISIEKT